MAVASEEPDVRTMRETPIDPDGEMMGRLPLEVTVLPRAFRVGAV
jgi:diacylglycerol kinase family enzyme